MGLYRGDLPSKIMKNLAFHRTTAENAAKILVEGIKRLRRGWELPDYKEDAPATLNARELHWAVYAAMVAGWLQGITERFSLLSGTQGHEAPLLRWCVSAAFEGRWTMNAIASKTFARHRWR